MDENEFLWENLQLEIYVAFSSGTDTPFSPTVFNDLELVGGSSKNRLVLDEIKDKENSFPTTPVSEIPTDPPGMLTNRPLEDGLKL